MLTARSHGISDFAAGLRRLVEAAVDRRQLEDAAGEYYVTKIVPDTFASGGATIGESWPPNLEGTQTLVQSGKLRDSITHQQGGIGEQIGSPLVYALSHQQEHAGEGFDGVIVAKNYPYLRFKVGGRWVSKQRVQMVHRTFLALPDPVLKAIAEGPIADTFERAMAG